ncbi:MAG: extracellular solute-binding protein [Chloroflexota bacterium]
MNPFSRICLTFMFVLSITACTALHPPSNDVVTISFGASEFDRSFYEPLIEAFNAENPDVQVQLVVLDPYNGSPDETMQRIVSAVDTAAVWYIRHDDITSGRLRDLTPFIESDAAFDRDDFYPGFLELSSYNEQFYLLPRSVNLPRLSYNKVLWEEAGLAPPTADWNWEEFVTAAEQLTVKRDDTIERYGFIGNDADMFFADLAAQGVHLTEIPMDQIQWDRPEVVAALQRLKEYRETGLLYQATIDAPSDVRAMIANQEIAIWEKGLFAPNSSDWVAPFEIGTTFYPTGSGFSSMSVRFDGFIMSSGTQYPQEAWQWLSFLSRQAPPLSHMFPDSAPIPARKSLALQSGYWDSLSDEMRSSLEAVLEQSVTYISSDMVNPLVNQAFGQAMRTLSHDTQSLEQALQDVQNNFEEQVAIAALTPTPDVTAQQIIVATPIPSIVPENATRVTFNPGVLDGRQVQRIADVFNQADTGVFVQLNDEGLGDLAVQANTSDCFAMFEIPEKADLQAVQNLQPLIDADMSFALDDYPAIMLEPLQQDLDVYGLPQAAYLRTLIYNETRFDDADAPYPTIDWTTDTFFAVAEQLTSDSEQYGFGDADPNLNIPFFANDLGTSLVEMGETGIRPRFTDPQVVAALRQYVDLLAATAPQQQFVATTEAEIEEQVDIRQLFRAGQVAMMFDFGFSHVEERPEFVSRMAPPPFGDRAPTTNDVFPIGMFISENADVPATEACLTWIKHLSTQAPLVADTFPARKSMAQSEEFLAQVPEGAEEVYSAYLEAFERGPVPDVARVPIIDPSFKWHWLYQAIDQALQGENLEEALEDAQRLTTAHLECVQDGGSTEDCAEQVDPEYETIN